VRNFLGQAGSFSDGFVMIAFLYLLDEVPNVRVTVVVLVFVPFELLEHFLRAEAEPHIVEPDGQQLPHLETCGKQELARLLVKRQAHRQGFPKKRNRRELLILDLVVCTRGRLLVYDRCVEGCSKGGDLPNKLVLIRRGDALHEWLVVSAMGNEGALPHLILVELWPTLSAKKMRCVGFVHTLCELFFRTRQYVACAYVVHVPHHHKDLRVGGNLHDKSPCISGCIVR